MRPAPVPALLFSLVPVAGCVVSAALSELTATKGDAALASENIPAALALALRIPLFRIPGDANSQLRPPFPAGPCAGVLAAGGSGSCRGMTAVAVVAAERAGEPPASECGEAGVRGVKC